MQHIYIPQILQRAARAPAAGCVLLRGSADFEPGDRFDALTFAQASDRAAARSARETFHNPAIMARASPGTSESPRFGPVCV